MKGVREMICVRFLTDSLSPASPGVSDGASARDLVGGEEWPHPLKQSCDPRPSPLLHLAGGMPLLKD